MTDYNSILALIAIITVLILSILTFAAIGIEFATRKNMGTIKVDCFDEFNNKIIGVQCEENISCGIIRTKYLDNCKIKEDKDEHT